MKRTKEEYLNEFQKLTKNEFQNGLLTVFDTNLYTPNLENKLYRSHISNHTNLI